MPSHTIREQYICIVSSFAVINDFPPEFNVEDPVHLHLSKELPNNTLVYTIMATDNDTSPFSSQIYYLLQDSNTSIVPRASQLFRLHNMTGELRTIVQSPLTSGTYSVIVTAHDNAGGYSNLTLTVVIGDFPSPIPQFDFSNYTFTVLESLSVSSIVGTVVCRANNSDGLQLYTSNLPNLFSISSGLDAKITVNSSLEDSSVENRMYQVEMICENVNYQISITTEVVIIVKNVPEEWISFSQDHYNFDIREETENNIILSPNVTVHLYNRLNDTLNGSDITTISNITLLNEDSNFTYKDGTLISNVLIDREKVDQFNYTITAQLRDLPIVLAHIMIDVTDINDNAPSFSKPIYSSNAITTRTNSSTTILRVNVTDPDAGENAMVTLSLNDTTYFEIDPNGNVHISAAGISAGIYRLAVIATDNGTMNLSASSLIVLTVYQDPEDILQLFNSSYSFSIAENVIIGRSVGNVAVDIGDTDFVRAKDLPYYSFVETSNTFLLQHLSGEILTVNVIDRETEDEYNLTINIRSGNSFREIPLVISILDENDEKPQFPFTVYIFNCTSEVPASFQVSAVDRDIGLNRVISYTITENNNFTINNETGEITSSCPEEGVYRLTVMATDHGNPPESSMVSVVIVSSSSLPQSLNLTGSHFTVPEHSDYGTEVGPDQINVTNLSPSLLDEVEFYLEGNDSKYFHIESPEGVLRTLDIFDRERDDVYSVTVVAMVATEGRQINGTLDIEIVIIDINDNEPIFSEQIYSVEIVGPLTRRQAILSVNVSDADDTGSNSNYILSVSDSSFIVSGDEILVKSKLIYGIYSFVVSAVDKGEPPLTSEATVILRIIEPDPVKLVCQRDPFIFHISENFNISSHVIGKVEVEPGNEDVQLGILEYDLSNEYFSINRYGWIFTTEELDYESHYPIDPFIVRVTTYTSIGNPISTNCTVEVHLRDINDNGPVFTNLPNDLIIPEELKYGTNIFTVTANDSDQNAVLTFSLLTYSDIFSIDPNNGSIFVTGRIDREEIAQQDFVLTIRVNDSAIEAINNLFIMINDINDNPPQLIAPLTYKIPERCNCLGESYFTIIVRDLDINRNAEVSIELINLTDIFSISNKMISLDKELDFEIQNEFYLGLNLSDNGNISMKSEASIHIRVGDKPDSPPVFENLPQGKDYYHVPIAPNISAGTEFWQIQARDPDFDRVTYSIENVTGTDGGNFTMDDFAIGNVSGALSKKRTANFTSEQNATLFVLAEDTSMYRINSTIRVVIETVPQNLSFTQTVYHLRMPENTSLSGSDCSQKYLLDIVAVSRARSIDFVIVNSTFSTKDRANMTFELITQRDEADLVGGARVCLKSGKVLDYEEMQEVSITILGESATGRDVTTVQIELVDVNDHPPVITNDNVTLTIGENNDINDAILTVTVSDEDAGINKEYHLNLDAPGIPLRLNNITQMVSVTEILNYELEDEYTFVLTATDHGEIPMSFSKTFTLQVRDENDAPVFSTRHNGYVTFIKEEENEKVTILRVEVTDEDTKTEYHTINKLETPVWLDTNALEGTTPSAFEIHINNEEVIPSEIEVVQISAVNVAEKRSSPVNLNVIFFEKEDVVILEYKTPLSVDVFTSYKMSHFNDTRASLTDSINLPDFQCHIYNVKEHPEKDG